MAGPPPITNLQDVKAWLGMLKAGTSAPLSASMFDAPMVTSLFSLLPDKQPIALAVTSVDASSATLTGTATLIGEAGVTATFLFTQPADTLLCELTVAMPDTVAWSLLSDLHVGFGGLVAHFAPNARLGVVGLSFGAVATAGALTVPMTLAPPLFDGDWLIGAGEVKIGSLTVDAMKALAGNFDPTEILPDEMAKDLSNFNLTGFEAALDPVEGTCSLIRVGLEYTADWQFFGDNFTVQSIDLCFEVVDPFQPGQLLQAKLDAKMQVGKGGPVFDVGGQFPDKAVFARLEPGTQLNVTDVLEFMHVPLPKGFPAIDISTLSFVFHTEHDTFDFQLAITDPVPIIGSSKLDNFFFEVGATYDATEGIQPTGTLTSQFTIGTSTLLFSGTYSTSGVVMNGEVDDVQIGDIVDKLAADFGIPKSSVPGPIHELALKTARVSLDTTASHFKFTCEGITEFAGVTVDFTPTIDLAYGEKFEAIFGGTLVLKTKDGKESYEFDVTYNGGATDSSITAEYKGEAVGLDDLADALHLDLPRIPSDLDLGLDAVGFYYDFTTGALVLGADSKTYGSKAALASVKLPAEPPAPAKREFFFVLDVGTEFSLSNLPLVGHELARIEDVSISALKVVIASIAADKDTATAVNADIANLKKAAYPRLPADGAPGTFLMTAEMQVGNNPLPLNVSLGEPATKPTQELVAADAAAADGGATWFTVQKSFGPVTINRIGVLYQSDTQTLWFELDASLAFGPLEIDLIGLGIGSPISSFHPDFNLQGLGVAYSQPPLEIAGGLASLAPPGSKYIEFEGGLTVATGEVTIAAFGHYGDKEGFPSMFIFGEIAYPFGGPPAFFVTGAALGLGYNSELRTPTIDQVATFPFVEALPSAVPSDPSALPDKTPLGVLSKILDAEPQPWVKADAGSLWLAMGITFTSFEIVNSQALVTVQIGGHDLVIALIGTAHARFPQQSVPGPAYANIDLDLLVRFAPQEGVFSAQAQLAPSSFLLDPSCVLTGGFAFFVWYGDSPHAGDFVLTLGGYNPGYTPPAHYPAVPVVGFHWSVDDSITVSGGAYMAFTPAVMMAGGRLDATFQSGNLKAWFDAHADVLIRWKPFWIDADIGISVGASYKVDLLLTSFTVSVELGCELEIWGPETGGTVEVDWYIISFTIGFGAGKGGPTAVNTWADVEAMLPNTGDDRESNVLALTPVAGLATPTTAPRAEQSPARRDAVASGPPSSWPVRGGRFAFDAATSVPATTTAFGEHTFNGDSFHVHPLDVSGASSTVLVKVTDALGASAAAAFEAAPIRRDVPAALWGQPGGGVPSGDGQLVPNQALGLSLQVLPPQIGATAGPVGVMTALAHADLGLLGALMPLSVEAQPTGDVPVASAGTVAKIADPGGGIASATVTAARGAIYAGLAAIDYAPADANDPMSAFAAEVNCALAAEPMVVGT